MTFESSTLSEPETQILTTSTLESNVMEYGKTPQAALAFFIMNIECNFVNAYCFAEVNMSAILIMVKTGHLFF